MNQSTKRGGHAGLCQLPLALIRLATVAARQCVDSPRYHGRRTASLALVVAISVPATERAPGHPLPPQEPRRWIGTWATAPQPFLPRALENFDNQTLRLIVRVSAGGAKVRIRISNTYGRQPLRIGAAHIARRHAGADIDPGSDRPLRFRGRSSVSIPAGSMVVSDPVALDVPKLSELAISLFLPEATAALTSHTLALQTSYVASDTGDYSGAGKFPSARAISIWPFLTGVDVEASRDGAAIVAFGSSTTDGDGSTPDSNYRWTDRLAQRLQAGAVRNGELGVLNQGIIGNRLLKDSPVQARDRFGSALGQSGLARFDRDVIGQAGVRFVILALGINDITFPGVYTLATERVRATEIIAGYQRLIARAHRKGIRVIGTTLSPFEGATSHTPEKDAVRVAVNAWIRASGAFDAVVDFDMTVRDPSRPSRLLPGFDSGDHLHTNDAGYNALASMFSLALFAGR